MRLFILTFLIIYLLHLCSVVLFKSKYYKFKEGKQTKYFIKKYNLKFKNISEEKFYNLISITNSLIISIVFELIILINGLIFKLLTAFILSIVFILVTYTILGYYIKKKEGN